MVARMGTPKRRATYDDLCKVPDTMVAEIIDGELVTHPRPALPHAHAESLIGSDLCSLFHRPPGDRKGPGGWWILFEPELHLGDDVIVPDLAGWRRERVPVLPNVAAFTVAPDWACEVVSPATGAIDRGRKMRIYAREGLSYLWIVEPLARTVEVYRLEAGRWMVAATFGGAEPARIEPFEQAELDLARRWLEA